MPMKQDGKALQIHVEVVMKKKKFKQIKSALLKNVVRKCRSEKMRDRRLRRAKEKQSVTEGWD